MEVAWRGLKIRFKSKPASLPELENAGIFAAPMSLMNERPTIMNTRLCEAAGRGSPWLSSEFWFASQAYCKMHFIAGHV